MHWNGGLVEARHNHKHHVFSAQHTCATVFFFKMWYDSVEKCFFWIIYGGKYCPKPPKICMTIFHLVTNKRLIWTVKSASRINLFAWAIFLYGKRCNMYRVYCLNYILNECEVKLKNTKSFNRVLQPNIFLNKWIWLIRCFQTHCQLSKFTIRDMPFKTKFTTLVDARGLADTASLKIIKMTTATLGAIADLELFLGGVFTSLGLNELMWSRIDFPQPSEFIVLRQHNRSQYHMRCFVRLEVTLVHQVMWRF